VKLNELLTRHAILSTEKQYRLAELAGDRPWHLSLERGRLELGSDLSWAVDILGTESHGDATWLWAWANEVSGFQSEVLAASKSLREYGVKHEVKELVEAGFPLSVADGFALASVAVGVLDCPAYYRVTTDEGAVYVLITDPAFPRDRMPPTERMVQAIRKSIQSFDIDAAAALTAYAEQHGGSFTRSGSTGSLSTGGKERLRVQLDARGKTSRIETVA
jgi:hypothetical protein